MKVFASTVIDAPAAEVWALVRDFTGLTAWSNVVTAAGITNDRAPDQVGAVRRLEIEGGGVFVETLVALSDADRCLSYDIVEGPIPVSDYVATLQVLPVTEGDRTYVSWSAEFDTPEGQADAMREVVGGQICTEGLRALKAYFDGRDA